MKQYLKETVIPFIIMSAIICLTISQTNAPKQPPPKEYTVTLNLDEWNNGISVIRQSRVEYPLVARFLDSIYIQLQKQISDTTKPKK